MNGPQCYVTYTWPVLLLLFVVVIGTDFTEPAGVMNEEPVAVASRGNLSTRLASPISIGRGLQNTFYLQL